MKMLKKYIQLSKTWLALMTKWQAKLVKVKMILFSEAH